MYAMHGVILLQKLHQIGHGYSDVLLLLRYIFTARRYASAVLAVVVCPSVCLSQAGIVSKRQHIESRKQRRTVAQGI